MTLWEAARAVLAFLEPQPVYIGEPLYPSISGRHPLIQALRTALPVPTPTVDARGRQRLFAGLHAQIEALPPHGSMADAIDKQDVLGILALAERDSIIADGAREAQDAPAPTVDAAALDAAWGKWWRDGSMVVDADGPLDDDQHFVADAASDDDAQRFVDWHNEAVALAVAHDRRPYPTAWAYEQACRVRDELRAELAALRASAPGDEG